MRKIIVLEHISMDGVIQSPGGPDEDTSGAFKYGGWISAYSDEAIGAALMRRMSEPFDLLLGRKTFDIWASFWPEHSEHWPGVMTAAKYVASNTVTSHEWQPSVFLSGDVAEKVAKLKQGEGPDLHIWGSSDLLQTLMKNDLVDAFWLMIYPVTLGSGKRLFANGTIPAAYRATESVVGESGVIHVTYERAGDIILGEAQPEEWD